MSTPKRQPFLRRVLDDAWVKIIAELLSKGLVGLALLVLSVLGVKQLLKADTEFQGPSDAGCVIDALMKGLDDRLLPHQLHAHLQRVNEEKGFPIKDPRVLPVLSTARLADEVHPLSPSTALLVRLSRINADLGFPVKDEVLKEFVTRIDASF